MHCEAFTSLSLARFSEVMAIIGRQGAEPIIGRQNAEQWL